MKKNRSIRTLMTLAVFSVLLLSSLLTFIGIRLYLLIDRDMLRNTSSILVIIIVLGVCVVLGTLLSIPITRYFLMPVRRLAKATKQVAGGDFTVSVPEVRTPRELQELIYGFNSMVKELGSIEMFRNDFIGNFSHEFKTPINSILGFAKELQNDSSLTDKQKKEYLQIIVNESERLSNMANNVLLLTDLEHTTQLTDVSLFSLDEQLRRTLLLLESHWSEKDIELDIDLDTVNYKSNEEILSHLWINLLSNAIKFSHVGGKVRIQCKDTDSNIKVSVYNEGQGISAENIERIFDKFYQCDTSHKSEGYGLGLPLCKRVAELCGGHIRAQSEVGSFTEITVYLPKQRVKRRHQ